MHRFIATFREMQVFIIHWYKKKSEGRKLLHDEEKKCCRLSPVFNGAKSFSFGKAY